MNQNFTLTGRIVDVLQRRQLTGTVVVENGHIREIREHPAEGPWILPGLIDAHIHVESSLLVPSEFARLAAIHGTVATVSDPHEIANVLGLAGVRFMQEEGRRAPVKIFYGAPSCVPATPFETAGAELTPSEVETLLADPDIVSLSEMMNVPGVLNEDALVTAKLQAAQRHSKPVDGHSPGLRDPEAERYIAAGITTDHECVSLDEAREKMRHGMLIQIREGSAARDFEALWPLLREAPEKCMLCSDDKHPDDLEENHIDDLVRRALRNGVDLFDVLTATAVTPVKHYRLPVGLLQPGDPADFIVVDDLENFQVRQTYINGHLVAENGQPAFTAPAGSAPNRFVARRISAGELRIPARGEQIQAIGIIDGSLITTREVLSAPIRDGLVVADPKRDLLKLTVVNRYQEAPPALAMVRNFGLRRGALASSVAHDSHNIVAVGASDEELLAAVNRLMETQGGLVAVAGSRMVDLPLPVAGLMTREDGFAVSRRYAELNRFAREELGCPLRAPFMTLSFLALLVIPELKLSDKGLFDGRTFQFTDLFVI